MADKFIPSGEGDFAQKAQNFASAIGPEPQRFGVSREDADALVRAVEEFLARRTKASNKYRCSRQLLDLRNQARDNVKRLMEKIGRIVRISEQVSGPDKSRLGITSRPARLSKTKCPLTRPQLRYTGSRHSTRVGRKVHVLRAEIPKTKMGEAMQPTSRAKPAGAWGIAVYVELLDEHEKVPAHPGELTGGRPWFLQLSKRMTIEAEFPFADRPMRVVYWARWVGMNGDMGPFSQTCVAEFEGAIMPLKAMVDQTVARWRSQTIIITSARLELPEPIEEIETLSEPSRRLIADDAAAA